MDDSSSVPRCAMYDSKSAMGREPRRGTRSMTMPRGSIAAALYRGEGERVRVVGVAAVEGAGGRERERDCGASCCGGAA